MTYTYAILAVSRAVYTEVRKRLAELGYDQAFHDDANGGEVIDMHGIALAEEPPGRTAPSRPMCQKHGTLKTAHYFCQECREAGSPRVVPEGDQATEQRQPSTRSS